MVANKGHFSAAALSRPHLDEFIGDEAVIALEVVLDLIQRLVLPAYTKPRPRDKGVSKERAARSVSTRRTPASGHKLGGIEIITTFEQIRLDINRSMSHAGAVGRGEMAHGTRPPHG